MATATLPPAFLRVSSKDKKNYDLFMEYSNTSNLVNYASGWNLSKLTDLAQKAHQVTLRANPHLQGGTHQSTLVQKRQWELNHLSEIKRRLAQAIEYKRSYYENNILGMITRFVLKCFGQWHKGNTAAIVEAEDFLIRYDSRIPLEKNSNGAYRPQFLLHHSARWIRNHLDTSSFFNYNPRRAIPVLQNFYFDTLDPQRPQVVIEG